MASPAVTKLQVLVDTPGVEKLPRLASSLKRLTISTKEAGLSFTKLSAGLKQQAIDGGKSINNTRSLANAWKELAASVKFGSKEFQIATAREKRLIVELMKMEGRRMGGMRGLAKTGGSILASSIFGGPLGTIGAITGQIVGGPEAALTGGVYGGIANQLLSPVADTATYAADIKKQRMALKLVVEDNDKYAQSMDFLSQTSKDLAIPQEIITRQFTQLAASVLGAGGSIEDAQKSFLAITSGIRGTGGSLEDMNSALTATSQVWSKGKVSAEELRQQLGERLPGAFTLFAESMGKTPAELDKALEQGKVTLEDFLSFSETLIDRYGEKAVKIAQSTFAAGDRMQTALSKLKESMGTLIQPIGAEIQEFMIRGIEVLDKSIRGVLENMPKLISLTKTLAKVSAVYIAGWVALSTGKAITAIVDTFKMLRKIDLQRLTIEKAIAALKIGAAMKNPLVALAAGGTAFVIIDKALNAVIENTSDLFKNIDLIGEVTTDVKTKTEELGSTSINVWANMKLGAKSYFDSIKDGAKQIQEMMENAFTKMEDALVEFVLNGKLSFRDFARSVIADLTRIFIRSQMLSIVPGFKDLLGIGYKYTDPLSPHFRGRVDSQPLQFGKEYTVNALGNVYGKNGIVPFASGGVVHSPHIFPFKNGIGLLGEAGSEAIMPLRRNRQGRLGVAASGAGVGNIVVNVDASGSSVEGNSGQAEQLGSMLAAAVQAEIVNQQRPGGLLA